MSKVVFKIPIKAPDYTLAQKQAIVDKILNGLTKEEAEADFVALRQLALNDCEELKPLSTRGLKFANFFTTIERLATVTRFNLSFYELWKNKAQFKKKSYINSFVELYQTDRYKMKESDPALWYRIFNMKFGSITVFRPTNAMMMFCRFQPRFGVLNPCTGWGGICVGAAAMDIPQYIGVDTNLQLRKPYEGMIKSMQKYSRTKVTILFQDALTVDYSKYAYDMVLTSPPYYDLHEYSHMQKRETEEEWINDFYYPLFMNTYKHLKRGGYFCINIPEPIYQVTLLKWFGRPTHKVLLAKHQRLTSQPYHEYIYVWHKA
jgi:tRNA G10  N-methylase Trm11